MTALYKMLVSNRKFIRISLGKQKNIPNNKCLEECSSQAANFTSKKYLPQEENAKFNVEV